MLTTVFDQKMQLIIVKKLQNKKLYIKTTTLHASKYIRIIRKIISLNTFI